MVASSCVSSPMQQGVALAGADTMPRSSTIGVGPMESQAEVTKVVVASSCVSSSMQHEVALAGIDTMPRSPIISGGVDGASEMVTPPRASRTLRSPLGEAGLTPSLEHVLQWRSLGALRTLWRWAPILAAAFVLKLMRMTLRWLGLWLWLSVDTPLQVQI
jgi:hypothetical protein